MIFPPNNLAGEPTPLLTSMSRGGDTLPAAPSSSPFSTEDGRGIITEDGVALATEDGQEQHDDPK